MIDDLGKQAGIHKRLRNCDGSIAIMMFIAPSGSIWKVLFFR